MLGGVLLVDCIFLGEDDEDDVVVGPSMVSDGAASRNGGAAMRKMANRRMEASAVVEATVDCLIVFISVVL